ncbi:MAG: MFS transporter [Gemmatimonadota bacterium]|jgi:MFS family permease|nr:MFS transporter [Gemmatimonadota bacterium]|tara:strand:+ start:8815 stop:10059 length:1245 start_codon:yes stop_codon:yes gene_type:complete
MNHSLKAKGKLHRNVWVASGTSFLTDVSSEMLLNVLPLFLANVLGVRFWAVGIIEGIAETTASVLKLYSGWLSDRIRTRKPLAVLGYAIAALAKPFYYIASSWPHVLAIRWADRVGKGVRTAPRDALLADSTPAERRGLAFGLHRAADTGGAVIGLLLTLWIVQQSQGAGVLLQEATFRKLVLWSLIPAFLGVVLLAVGARDLPIPTSTSTKGTPGMGLRGLGRGFTAFAACSVLFEIGNSADAFLVLRAQERGVSVVGLLWMLLAFNVVYTLVSTPAGFLADRVPRKWVVCGGWCIYALVYLGFALVNSSTQVTLLYMIYGVYHGLVAGAAKALVADLVPEELRGTAYGAYAAVVGLVSLPASVLAGVLWQGLGAWSGFGAAAPFWLGAVTALAATVLLFLTVPAEPVNSARV